MLSEARMLLSDTLLCNERGTDWFFNGYNMDLQPWPSCCAHWATSRLAASCLRHTSVLLAAASSLPVDKPPPAVGTVPALQGTNVLLLLGDRTGQTMEFKRTRESHSPAGCPFSSTHLPPCLAKTAVVELQGSGRLGQTMV